MLPEALHTARLILRPIVLEDVRAIFDAYGRDPEVSRYTVWKSHRKVEDAEAYVRQCIAESPEVSRTYALCLRDGDALQGAVALRRTKRHQIEFGYVLARQWWGRGLMTEALTAVVEWALAQPDIFRVSGCCDIDNVASARVMEKAGLLREGLLRRWLVHPNMSDQPRDCVLYARVRS